MDQCILRFPENALPGFFAIDERLSARTPQLTLLVFPISISFGLTTSLVNFYLW
jgi:hypothetical protein